MSNLTLKQITDIETGESVSVESLIEVSKSALRKVSSIKDLISVDHKNSTLCIVTSYHEGWAVYASSKISGGGLFFWEEDAEKTRHDGGTVIDPEAMFPFDWNNPDQLNDWFDSANTGAGCWIRLSSDTDVSAEMYGARSDLTHNDLLSLQKCLDSKGYCKANGEYLIIGQLLLPSQGVLEGRGKIHLEGIDSTVAPALYKPNGEKTGFIKPFAYYTREHLSDGGEFCRVVSDSSAQSNTIVVDGVGSIAEGDYIYVTNGYCDMWRVTENQTAAKPSDYLADGVDMWRATIAKVASVSGNTVTISSPLGFDLQVVPKTYGFASDENNLSNYAGYNYPTVERLAGAVDWSVKGVEIYTNSALRAMSGVLARDGKISDVRVESITVMGNAFDFYSCYNLSILDSKGSSAEVTLKVRRGSTRFKVIRGAYEYRGGDSAVLFMENTNNSFMDSVHAWSKIRASVCAGFYLNTCGGNEVRNCTSDGLIVSVLMGFNYYGSNKVTGIDAHGCHQVFRVVSSKNQRVKNATLHTKPETNGSLFNTRLFAVLNSEDTSIENIMDDSSKSDGRVHIFESVNTRIKNLKTDVLVWDSVAYPSDKRSGDDALIIEDSEINQLTVTRNYPDIDSGQKRRKFALRNTKAKKLDLSYISGFEFNNSSAINKEEIPVKLTYCPYFKVLGMSSIESPFSAFQLIGTEGGRGQSSTIEIDTKTRLVYTGVMLDGYLDHIEQLIVGGIASSYNEKGDRITILNQYPETKTYQSFGNDGISNNFVAVEKTIGFSQPSE